MADSSDTPADPLSQIMAAQASMIETVFGKMMPDMARATGVDMNVPKPADMANWTGVAGGLQDMWQGFAKNMPQMPLELSAKLPGMPPMDSSALPDPEQLMNQWVGMVEGWTSQQPFVSDNSLTDLAKEMGDLWTGALGSMAAAAQGEDAGTGALPRKDRRFADPQWRSQPVFTLLHQSYLLMSEKIEALAGSIEHMPKDKQAQMRFAVQSMLEALSPANFPTTNPVVLNRTLETRGQNLAKGMQHLAKDAQRGQLTHTDPDAFELGKNIAVTPGKVVHETPLYQLIQYSPATDKVLETPLVIFPPWINRFYILDLNPKKSFVRWAVEQGVTTFMVSWKSADESMGEVVWDDYIRAQMDAIDHIRERLKVPAVHAIGYCVAGTTLASTLAIQAERGEADKVASATYFTAQVDFEGAGELLHYIDDGQLAAIDAISGEKGYLDGRFMALAFNMLRGTDLIWNYVVNNYLLGEDYPAFDLLHWNGDVTNLPAKWHGAYLRDLYRDNKLAKGEMSADGTDIDLSRVKTPTYIQAGREDHIAPAASVWKLRDHFTGPLRFVLAGSGHIAGVVNPPEAGKYQYWLNDAEVETLDQFVEGSTEHKGSWWPDWIEWIHSQSGKKIAATGKRKPGTGRDKVIEDAPGRYVMTR